MRGPESLLLGLLSPTPRELGKASWTMGSAVDPWMSLKSNAAVASLKGAGILRARLSSSSPYSPKCLEGVFSEVKPFVAPSVDA